jgi:TonB family protein
MKLARFPLALCALLLAAPAAAQVTAQPAFTLHRDAENCWVGNEPVDPSAPAISAGISADGSSWVRASGKDWPFAPDGVYRLLVEPVPSGSPTAPPTVFAIVVEGYRDAAGRPGFMIRGTRALAPGDWAPTLVFYRKDDAEPFATLANPLSASRAALDACMLEFARNDRGSGAPAATAPMPRGNPAYWVTGDDYPAAALRAEDQGRVAFQVTVSAHGVASDCIVTASSGSAMLDTAACRLIMRRGRFLPARDAEEKATQGSYSSVLAWVIPADDP